MILAILASGFKICVSLMFVASFIYKIQQNDSMATDFSNITVSVEVA